MLLIGFIWFVTVVDIYCCQWLTAETELNPVAQFILAQYGVWTLISAKVLGTWVVTECLRYLQTYFSVIIALFMLILLLVLNT